MTRDRLYWIALAMCPGIGPKTFRTLLARFGSPRAVFDADVADLATVPRLTANALKAIAAAEIDDLERQLASLSHESIELITFEDEVYPGNLQNLPDAPPVLYLRGNLIPADERAVAIVGSRDANAAGLEHAQALATGFAERGWTVVSGLAMGIDTAAHESAVRARGRTIGVLGSGIRVIHPKRNVDLVEEMVQNGAVLSEFAPDTPPLGRNLMARDRIVSGLGKATIVVQAGEKSGSVDTAKRARKQDRPVFAVAGSPGTDRLIEAGAIALQPGIFDFEEMITTITKYKVGERQEQMDMFPNR